MRITVDKMRPEDWPAVREIYGSGLDTGQASFETEVPDWQKFDAKYVGDFRLVARADDGRVLGWAALTRVSDRRAYAGVGEVSVYVAPEVQGRGVGEQLLRALIDVSEHGGIWTLQAGIIPANSASVRLHKKCGFREVGRRERLGKRDGVWYDALLLERRSNVVGID